MRFWGPSQLRFLVWCHSKVRIAIVPRYYCIYTIYVYTAMAYDTRIIQDLYTNF